MVKVNKAVVHVHILIQGGHQVPGGKIEIGIGIKISYCQIQIENIRHTVISCQTSKLDVKFSSSFLFVTGSNLLSNWTFLKFLCF